MYALPGRFFGAPPGGNDAATVRRRLLSRVLNVHMMAALAVSAFYPAGSAFRSTIAPAALATIPLALLMRVLLHRGRVQLASWIFLTALAGIAATLATSLAGSLAIVPVTIFQMALIVMSGLLIEGRGAVAFTAAIVASNGVLFWLESLRWPERSASLEAVWALDAVFFMAVAALLAGAVKLAEETLDLVGRETGERQSAEAERERLIRELERRNAELERFTYTVSHDLKSPLITIRGFLGHIEQAAIEGKLDSLRADMDRVYKSTARMHRLLDDLLELARVGRLAKLPEEVRFEEIVRDALDRTHGRLTAHKVTVEVQNELPSVLGDRDRLIEVMQNLIDNAAKFMGSQPEPRIWIGSKKVGDEQAFFLRDNGAGIEPRYRERVFNLFDKLDPKSAGTGVGLALVKRIVEVHGGRIWLESEGRGTGSTFLFTLGEPAKDDPPAPAPKGPA
jgi:signal transduction histidine kinase